MRVKINLGSKNKFAGYSLGLIINNKDIISVAQFITDEELLKADRENGFSSGLTFGRKRVLTTESGYHLSADGSPHHGILGRVAATF